MHYRTSDGSKWKQLTPVIVKETWHWHYNWDFGFLINELYIQAITLDFRYEFFYNEYQKTPTETYLSPARSLKLAKRRNYKLFKERSIAFMYETWNEVDTVDGWYENVDYVRRIVTFYQSENFLFQQIEDVREIKWDSSIYYTLCGRYEVIRKKGAYRFILHPKTYQGRPLYNRSFSTSEAKHPMFGIDGVASYILQLAENPSSTSMVCKRWYNLMSKLDIQLTTTLSKDLQTIQPFFSKKPMQGTTTIHLY
jgi:hypothetical protein